MGFELNLTLRNVMPPPHVKMWQ